MPWKAHRATAGRARSRLLCVRTNHHHLLTALSARHTVFLLPDGSYIE